MPFSPPAPPAAFQTIRSHRHTKLSVAPGLALTSAPGVAVVSVLEPLTRKLLARAVGTLRSHRRHPLDIAAIVLPPGTPPLPPRTVQRLAGLGVVIADAPGESTMARAENYVTALAEAQAAGLAHLRAFAESVQQRRGATA